MFWTQNPQSLTVRLLRGVILVTEDVGAGVNVRGNRQKNIILTQLECILLRGEQEKVKRQQCLTIEPTTPEA